MKTFAISALLVGAVATVGFCLIGSSASEVTQAQTSNAEIEVEEDRPDEQHRFLEVEEVTSDSTPPPSDDDDSTPPPSDDEKSQVVGTIKMSVSPAVLKDPAAKKALTESVAGEVAGRLNVSLEAVSVELEVSGSRRLADPESQASGGTKAVTVKCTVDVPPGADASQMVLTMEAVEPATLTATVNQALSEVNPEYEVVVEAITAIEVIPSTTSVPSATSTTQEPATNAAAPRGASALLLAASAGALAAAAASRLAW